MEDMMPDQSAFDSAALYESFKEIYASGNEIYTDYTAANGAHWIIHKENASGIWYGEQYTEILEATMIAAHSEEEVKELADGITLTPSFEYMEERFAYHVDSRVESVINHSIKAFVNSFFETPDNVDQIFTAASDRIITMDLS